MIYAQGLLLRLDGKTSILHGWKFAKLLDSAARKIQVREMMGCGVEWFLRKEETWWGRK